MAHDRNLARLESVAEMLWTERHLVELLLYKLVAAKLLLAADERRFVALALTEVERVVDTLRTSELQRDVAVAAVAQAWHVPVQDVTLATLAERAPEPLRAVFDDHRRAFMDLTAEIEQTASENRRLASAALTNVREALTALTNARPQQATYTAEGRTQPITIGASRLDEAL